MYRLYIYINLCIYICINLCIYIYKFMYIYIYIYIYINIFSTRALNNGSPCPGLPWFWISINLHPTLGGLRYILFNVQYSVVEICFPSLFFTVKTYFQPSFCGQVWHGFFYSNVFFSCLRITRLGYICSLQFKNYPPPFCMVQHIHIFLIIIHHFWIDARLTCPFVWGQGIGSSTHAQGR
jgi:hypothetical protein